MTTARHLIAAITALGIGLLPLAATANPGSGFRKTQKGVMSRHVPALMKGKSAQVLYAQNCPPGLAKKSLPCIPPGQAKKSPIRVGDVIDLGSVHVVTRPGAYGLSVPPAGDSYAIVDKRLVRVDSDSGKILSILRLIDAILD